MAVGSRARRRITIELVASHPARGQAGQSPLFFQRGARAFKSLPPDQDETPRKP